MLNWENIPDSVSFFQNFATELSVLLVLGFGRVIGIDLFWKLRYIYNALRFLILRVFGIRIALVYTDCDEDGQTTRRIARHLSSQDQKIQYIPISDPALLQSYPLFNIFCEAVIIFITDVTPLSTNHKNRISIQKKLQYYVAKGGVLILGHDVIYRRTRNNLLQNLAGCTAIEFQSEKRTGTLYHKFSSCEEILANRHYANPEFMSELPDNFVLKDNEIVGGEWAEDVKFLYIHGEKSKKQVVLPLVTMRLIDEGIVYWLNTGDKKAEGDPPALTQLDDNLMKILKTFVNSHQRFLTAASSNHNSHKLHQG